MEWNRCHANIGRIIKQDIAVASGTLGIITGGVSLIGKAQGILSDVANQYNGYSKYIKKCSKSSKKKLN